MNLIVIYRDVLDNVAGMMYRPTSSGLLVPTSYQFGSNQIFQVKMFSCFLIIFINNEKHFKIFVIEKVLYIVMNIKYLCCILNVF